MKKKLNSIIVIFVLLVSFSLTVKSEPMHGIAMHGDTKYPRGFKHLDYANPNAPKGGNLRLAVTGSFDSINSFIIKGSPAAGRQYVFESLLGRVWDEPFSLYGLIAESIEVPLDRSWVKFYIRSKARFHDGTKISADDVIFSWELLRKEGRANMRLFYNKVSEVEKISNSIVKFTFKEEAQDRELPLLMGLMPILSKNFFSENEFNKTTLEPIVGSGPYKVKEIIPGRKIVYKRIKNYWGNKLPIRIGHNNFDTISYEYFRDSNVLMEAFKSGEFDLKAEYSASRWRTAYNFPSAKNGMVKLEEIQNSRPSGMKAFVFNSRKEIFKDLNVRKAIGYAFDFEWINKNLFNNVYTRTDSFFANSDLASSDLPTIEEKELLVPIKDFIPKTIFTQKYRPQSSETNNEIRIGLKKANELLEKSGWVIEKGKRLKILNNGKKLLLKFEILLVNPDNERIAIIFSKNLKKLGIDASIRTVDSAQYQKRRQNYDFDMIINKWRVTLSPGNEQAYYWGSKAATDKGTRNYIGIKNKGIDKLIEKITKTTERKELVTAIRALDRVLLHNFFVIPMYHIKFDRVAYWNKITRPNKTPIYGYVLETWWEKNN
ncbi:MAG: Oligopeptide-binding protein AppA [Alphaproteobacteria bacterium MarineAlpha2_Bin1]|nr:MAG: Oligopeptide-binding protein AppA [Alphaproteobacteria bacterium MarineAlpha2_Bin1]